MVLVLAAFVIACGDSGSTVAGSNTPANAGPEQGNNSLVASTRTPESAPAQGKPFRTTVELHGISFQVQNPNTSDTNTVKVTPSGLETTNEPVTREVRGEVVGAEVGDLNVDQSPEVYIYVSKKGDRKGMDLVAFSTNNRKSMSEIALEPDDPDSKTMEGYNGGDEYAVVENSIVRRFPVYRDDGGKWENTGKMRQFQYKLKKGEATWRLTIENTAEY